MAQPFYDKYLQRTFLLVAGNYSAVYKNRHCERFCEAIQKYFWIASPYKKHKARNDGNRDE